MRVSGFIVGAVVALGLALGADRPAAGQGPARWPATILRVEDGRTVWLDTGNPRPLRVRLAWIAVPGAPGANSAGAPHAAEARRRLEVWKGQRVEFLTFGSDPEGLPLVELLWRPTADSVIVLNYEMVRSGFARADCSTSGEDPLRCRVLRRAEDLARQERRGMWAPGS